MSTSLTSVNRSVYLDNLAGLLIIHMIYTCHLAAFCQMKDSKMLFVIIGNIFCFFMPWFFFKSGMFYRGKSLRRVLHDNVKRLFVPYVVFNVVGVLVGIFLSCYVGYSGSFLVLIGRPIFEIFKDEATSSNLALWFLMSLAIARILFSILYGRFHIHPIIICLVFLVLACCLNYYNYQMKPNSFMLVIGGRQLFLRIPCYIGNMCYGMFFYCLGFLLREKQYNNYLFAISVIIYIFHFVFVSRIDFRSNESSANYPLAVLYSVTGIICFNNIFKSKLNVKIPILTYVGKQSMVYYVTHYAFFALVFGLIGKNSGVNNWLLYFVGFFLVTLFLFVIDKIFRKEKLKWMVGN
jgi:fucose 4-O-acetylase-like acetyltransferase